MRTRTFGWWGVLTFSCVALLTIWAQTGRPQPVPADSPYVPVPANSAPPLSVTLPAAAPAAPTVEDLIKQLEVLRKQKADLEAQEKAVVSKLQERLKDQKDRLSKLGVLPQAPPPPPDAKDDVRPVDAILPPLKK
jgi:hypothetical protein